MSDEIKLHKNPSREACQKIVKRILVTEVLEEGKNTHFKSASDFMNYFESLYPASDSLTKQVQRAVKSMNMPKDEHGYYIINKTTEQLDQENELRSLVKKNSVSIDDLNDCETIFLSMDSSAAGYFSRLLLESVTFGNFIVTILQTGNGLLLYTRDKARLLPLLSAVLLSSN